jgi:hypothetical protein
VSRASALARMCLCKPACACVSLEHGLVSELLHCSAMHALISHAITIPVMRAAICPVIPHPSSITGGVTAGAGRGGKRARAGTRNRQGRVLGGSWVVVWKW